MGEAKYIYFTCLNLPQIMEVPSLTACLRMKYENELLRKKVIKLRNERDTMKLQAEVKERRNADSKILGARTFGSVEAYIGSMKSNNAIDNANNDTTAVKPTSSMITVADDRME